MEAPAPPTRLNSTPAGRVVIVDDDDRLRDILVRLLTKANFDVVSLSSGAHVLDVVREKRADVVMLDWHMPHFDGFELLDQIKRATDVEVIMMTGEATVDAAVRALKAGAYDFLTKPFLSGDLTVAVVARAVAHHRLRVRNDSLTAVLGGVGKALGLVGESPAMRKVHELIQTVAQWPTTVLVTGESGTGKELVARAIHTESPRKGKPFIAINCSALPEALLESELFGHVRGAFSSAVSAHEGLFRAADQGTLFLDEIGELPLPLQSKLLRVLQESEVRAVGSTTSIKVDVRIVAATNVDLVAARTAGTFRDDLYFRLDVVKVALPPLRARVEDIVPLANHFLRKHTLRMNKSVTSISPEAAHLLAAYDWPGNVRELENVMERAIILCKGESLLVADFELNNALVGERPAELPVQLVEMPIIEARRIAQESFDRRYIEAQMRRANGNVSTAARAAGMDRANFRRLLKRYQVRPDMFADEEEPTR